MVMEYILIIFLMFCSGISFGQSEYNVTPLIADTKINNSKTAEQTFVENFLSIPMIEWVPGMKFIVIEPNDYDVDGVRLELYELKSKSKEEIRQKDYAWKIFTLKKIEEKKARGRWGIGVYMYYIFDCDGEEFVYEPSMPKGSMEELAASGHVNVIDRIIYLGDIDKAKEMLIGKKLYVCQKCCFKDKEGNKEIAKYVPVVVKNIGAGRTGAPVKIVCELDNGKSTDIDIVLSQTNTIFKESFTEYFLFDNPRSKFPNINDDDWDYMTHENVRVGMNKSLCRLCWGNPSKVNKTKGENFKDEQWVYEPVILGGITFGHTRYLYFEDDVLKIIQD